MKMETIVITPELAKKWLLKNSKNRRIDTKRVAIYADDMINGRWKVNAETIKFNGEILLDGQHRLLACVKAKIPFVSVVVSDISGDIFDTIDRGKPRSPGDIFHLAGEKNAVLVSAGLSVVHKYIKGVTFEGGGGEQAPSVGRLEELLIEYPEAREMASFISGLSWLRKVIRRSLVVGIATLTYREEPELTRAFWRDLNDGTNMFQPVAKLREKLIDNSISRRKFRLNDIGAMIIRSWNAVIDGEEIKVLRALRTEGDRAEQRPVLKGYGKGLPLDN